MSLVIVLVAADQITKQIAMQYLGDGHSVVLLPVLQLVLVFNKGAAFGIFSQAGGWQHIFLSALAFTASVVLLVWIWRICEQSRQLTIALALVLGGALGNLLDRLIYQFVIDFILVHYQQYRFPAFNIADSVITIGAILLIADSFGWQFLDKTETHEQSHE